MPLQRPTAEELLSGAVVFQTTSPTTTSPRGVPFRDTGTALSVLHSVEGQDGALPATMAGSQTNLGFCRDSTLAIRRSIRYMAAQGGGKVLIPRVVEGGVVRPFMYAGPLLIENGVELVVEGELKMIGGLTAGQAQNASYFDPPFWGVTCSPDPDPVATIVLRPRPQHHEEAHPRGDRHQAPPR